MTRIAAFLVTLVVSLIPAAPAYGAGAWRWPLRGELLTPYRNGANPYAGGQHRGIDIAGPVGAPVIAATGGSVRFAGTVGSSGLTVSVRTSDGRYDTSYLHLSSAAVRAGERVAAGDRIGAVGTSGRRSATAPHLHFGVRDADSRTAYHDPLDFLVPVAVPRRDPAPPGAPAPVGAPARPAPAPLGRPLPAPAGRRVRVPAGRVREPGPVPRVSPRAVPALAPRPAHNARPLLAPRGAPEARRLPAARPAPQAAPTLRPHVGEPRPAAIPSRREASAPGRGPDLGLALACLGLLAAAAVIGLRPDHGTNGERRRERVRAFLGPLLARSRS